MAKVFYVRHQAAGVMHEFPFAETPTEEQQRAVARHAFLRFGATHPKNNEPYWTRIEERELIGNEVPAVPDVVLTPVSVKGHAKGETGETIVAAVGHVENPGVVGR